LNENEGFIKFLMQKKSLESQNSCFVFGGGTRLCPGKELGIVEISSFLHYFVTRYRCVHGDDLMYLFCLKLLLFDLRSLC